MDDTAIPYLGYLPQDIEGEDIFNFYHPSDLLIIKEAYENIMGSQGKPFKSRPFRLKAKNGCYITVETIWSCFINPWSKKLEFIDGKHKIVKGPTNVNVFSEPGESLSASGAEPSVDSPQDPTSGSNEEVTDAKQVLTKIP